MAILRFLQQNAEWMCAIAIVGFTAVQCWLAYQQNMQNIRMKRLELASKLDWAYEHRDEIRERKQKNLQYSKECWQRHLDRLARREAHEKKIAEIKARKEAEKPKRKRQRIVRYEKV